MTLEQHHKNTSSINMSNPTSSDKGSKTVIGSKGSKDTTPKASSSKPKEESKKDTKPGGLPKPSTTRRMTDIKPRTSTAAGGRTANTPSARGTAGRATMVGTPGSSKPGTTATFS